MSTELTDLRARLNLAADRLAELAESGEGYQPTRLHGKREGVLLAISYVDEALRAVKA